ncbi:HWE histidine kinase domain-containing protein, partial [Tianweitania sp.]|uniref:HWE histidine kinase domain-containing protein n=1 Tax=Tianweitania sp. TaxID=2021634 RepID=UPI00289D36E0
MTAFEDAKQRAELQADNARLRQLLDQRNAPGELRHRLTTTLAMLRTIIRKSAETKRDLDAYVGHIEDRVSTVAHVHAAVDKHGGVELQSLLANELLNYGAKEGEQVTLAGPYLLLQPKAGQVFALAVHELAVNAVEHGALGMSEGRIDVAWKVDRGGDEMLVTFTWKESGQTGLSEGGHKGFGTEVL